jgi:hypothetical protein
MVNPVAPAGTEITAYEEIDVLEADTLIPLPGKASVIPLAGAALPPTPKDVVIVPTNTISVPVVTPWLDQFPYSHDCP